MNKRAPDEEAEKMFDRASKLEQEFSEYFTGSVYCLNINFDNSSSIHFLLAIVSGDTYEEIYMQIKRLIHQNSGPVIWIPVRDSKDLD